jgi:ABC-2 type transport system ATP-binding protein
MGASQFVGRVGGLALALGIGAGVFAGSAGVAWAEESARDSGITGSSADSGSDSSQAGPSTRGRTTTAVRGSAAAEPAGLAAPATADEEPISLPDLEVMADPEPVVEVVADPEPVVEVVADPEPVVEVVADPEPVVEVVADGADPLPVAVAEPQPAAADSGSVDQLVAELPTAVALQTTADAAVTSAPTAKADSAPLTVAPVTTYFDGILQGNLNVTSASGCGLLGSTCKLTYTFVDSSDGGKVTLGKVPVALDPLLPDGAKGGDGSYTFLPYATWIDPENPTSFPIATGTQTFSVRITEDTQFNQTVTSIPLIGLFAAPIIDLMQQLPLISSLLAPLIGASLVQTVNVNVGALVSSGVTKQVAYTYIVDSFDGTPISMNYFPASAPSLVLEGQKQATIFNGPGLGSPGETNPYGLFQAAGSVPGLSIMRGQGLPAPFDAVPLGFNVITWDPRGEFASGGVLQLDNPFFEGRDVSSLIDWALVNTPLLSEPDKELNDDDEWVPVGPDKPDIAMMGGSYGGGIQLTTVDPRIKVVVPAIAWNSLNSSLYPTEVFKTAWANTLALALLEAGATVNPLIDQGILYGNLFGFLTPEQQAALASSGPTVLLTKLSIPTMYNQGTIDALFPLQQAIDNAQTQLEQNPFFAGQEDFGTQALVKMIWFCGGHGVCTTQSAAQQTAQNTIMFLENMIWANLYAKPNLTDFEITLPPPFGTTNLYSALGLINGLGIKPFQIWDQNGTALASDKFPWTDAFQDVQPLTAFNVEGGRINSFTSRSGPLTADDPAGAVCAGLPQACQFPLNQVFATKANNAVNVDITVPYSTTKKDPLNPAKDVLVPSGIYGAPLVSFTYSGVGNAKAVYAQVVDNATGQVLGNINTAIPVTLDGKERTVEAFPIANIAYTAGQEIGGSNSLTLQILANSSLYQNNAVIWSVDISDVAVILPTTSTVTPNPIVAFLPT